MRRLQRERGTAGIGALAAEVVVSSNAVELEVGLGKLALAVDVEEVEAVDLVCAVAEVRLDPLPNDLVATSDVDRNGVLNGSRAGLREGDEAVLVGNGGGSELLFH